MTEAEFAAGLRAEGQGIVESGGVWWRRVRPFFYRRVLPYAALPPGVAVPWQARIGGVQFAIQDANQANSQLQTVMFDDAAHYSVERLPPKRRWEVRTALKRVSVRSLKTPEELYAAHPAYIEFQRRTGYGYLAGRLERERFEGWCDGVFRHVDVIVAGYFIAEELAAVSICRLVESTLLYSTCFASDAALAAQVPSLALHNVRQAAVERQAAEIFVGMRKTTAYQGVDDFYLHRGAVVRTLPARLEVNPVTRVALQGLAPRVWRTLSE